MLANSFFVLGEFAIVAVERTAIEQMAEEGHRGARSTLQALKSLSFQLSGAQLGITISSLIAGFLVEPAIGRALEPLVASLGLPAASVLGIAIALALVLATAIQMVVGELVPKNLAIAKPFAVAFLVVTPMRLVNALFKPLILFLNSAANWTVRLLGVQPKEELIPVRSIEELDLLIHSSRQEGALDKEEFELLTRSIDFGEKTAADALTPRVSVVALSEDDTLEDMARMALDQGLSRFPVYRGDLDDIAGIVYVKNGYRVPLEERATTPVSAIVQDALVVPESRPLDSLLLEMRGQRKHMAIVVDEYGGTAGIVTLEDLLEEIVGEIEDEHDVLQEPRSTPAPEGVYRVSGLLHRGELLDTTGFEMPEGHYETLAGFLLHLFERIPRQGEHISYEGWEFKIIEMDGKRIAQVLCAKQANERNGEPA